MERIYYPELEESLYRERLANGLTVAVVPRPGFRRKIAYFITDRGSIHRRFTLDGEPVTAPAGIAHYLEHKLFDMPGRDISGEFAALGANPNAFTSYDMTAYYFSCTENFDRSLALLLEFVSTPWFTEESVQKEREIIGQEIDMNGDTPETVVFENLTAAMYREHPIREPILGTRESIARITPELLTLCHRACYRPEDMLLCVVGDVDPERVRDIALETLPRVPAAVCRMEPLPREDMTCPEALVTARMEVAMPMFQLGFKAQAPGTGTEEARQELIGDLAAEALFGESSELYLRLYEEGLIDSSFGGGFETVEGMAMLTASGDSWEPEKLRDAILEQAEALVRRGIPEEDFLRMKRSAMGRRIRDLDSFESTCFRVCAYHFTGFDYFRFPEIFRSVEEEEILAFIKETVTRERCCLSVIYPLSEEKEENHESQ